MDQHKNRSAWWVSAVEAATEDLGSLGITPGPATLCFHMTTLPPAPLKDDPLIHSTSLSTRRCQLPQICLTPSISFLFVQFLETCRCKMVLERQVFFPNTACETDRSKGRMNQKQERICLIEWQAPRTSETKDTRSVSCLYTRRTDNEPVFQVSVVALTEMLNFCVSFCCPHQKICFMGNCMFSS